MREELFRGKRVDNNEWVKGFYYQLGSKHYIRKDIHIWEVDHETVGQFAGLTDKNGVKIFEGDEIIVSEFNRTYIVKSINGCFKLAHKDPAMNGYVWGTIERLIEIGKFPFEVIGNIHDNPELLNK